MANLSPYRHASNVMPALMGKAPQTAPPRVVPGLPRVGLGNAKRWGGMGNPQLGATVTYLDEPPGFAEVTGAPSIGVELDRVSGGVVTKLQRRSMYAPFITRQGKRELELWAQGVLQEAIGLSQGGLTLGELAKRGNPYGRGARNPAGKRRRGLGKLQGNRAGVSNLAVANRQSGELARGWTVEVVIDRAELNIYLRNSSAHSPYLALGTVRMRAHGPFTTPVAKGIPALNAMWRRITREAFFRAQAAAAAPRLGGEA